MMAVAKNLLARQKISSEQIFTVSDENKIHLDNITAENKLCENFSTLSSLSFSHHCSWILFVVIVVAAYLTVYQWCCLFQLFE